MIPQYRRGSLPSSYGTVKKWRAEYRRRHIGFENGPWARRPKTVTDYINTDRGLQFVEIGRPSNLEELGEIYGITNR